MMSYTAAIIVTIYMVVLLLVSWYAGWRQRKQTAEGFLFADKQLTWPLVGVMVAGIAIGGASTIGIAQNSYTMGMSAGWYNAAWAAGALVMGLFFADRLRQSRYQTINQIMGAVFDAKFQLVSTILQLLISTVIICLQIIAGGAILAALLPDVFTMESGILVSTLIFGMISTVGGMLAASLTNVVNLTMIYVGVIIAAVLLVVSSGGFDGMQAMLPAGLSEDGSHWFHPVKGMGMVVIAAWFTTMIIMCSPNGGVIQTVFAAKDPKHAKKGAIFGALMILPVGFISAVIGIASAALVPGLESSAMALPAVVMTLPAWVGGIILSGLWAADVSTATGLMMGVSSMFCEDILFKYVLKGGESGRKKVITQVVMLGVVVVAYFMATQVSNILGALMTALSLFSAFFILMISIFYFPQTCKQSTGWLTLGFSVVTFFIVQFIEPGLRLGGQTIYSVLLAALIGFTFSQIDRRPSNVQILFTEGSTEEITG